MPIDNLSSQECFDCFLDEYKSRGNNHNWFKYATGHTYKKLKKRDFDFYNQASFISMSDQLTKEQRERFEKEKEMIVTKREKEHLNNKNYMSNQNVDYSMNKKKRWLLPDLLELKANEVKQTAEYNESDENSTDSYALNVYFHEKSSQKNVFAYFDNNGNAINARLKNASIESQFFGFRGRRFRAPKDRKRLIDLNKYFRSKRRLFKNGNRNRNTGIKRNNETFLTNSNQTTNNELHINHIKYHFTFTPKEKVYKTLKSWRSGLKRYPGVFDQYGVNSNNEYQNFMGRKARVLIKHSVKQKKHSAFSNQIDQELINLYDDFSYDHLYEGVFPCEINMPFYYSRREKKLKVNLKEILKAKKNNNFKHLKSVKIKREMSNNYYSQSKNNVIQVSSDDAFFFNHVKKYIQNTASAQNETTQIISSQLNEHLFEKYNLTINDKQKFLTSIAVFAKETLPTVCREVYPNKLIFKLDSAIKERFSAELNFNLIFDFFNNQEILLDYVYLNIDFKDDNLLSKKNELIKYLQNTIEVESLNDFVNILDEFFELNTKISLIPAAFEPKKDLFYLIGQPSVFGQTHLTQELNSCLNNAINNEYCSFDNFLIFDNSNEQKIKETCEICYDDLDWPAEFVRLEQCGHFACKTCWREYIRTNISNMKVTTSFEKNANNKIGELVCLQEKCCAKLSLNVITSLVSANLANKYVEFYADMTIARNRNKYVYCKNEKCTKLMFINDTDKLNMVTICECGYMICNLCLNDMHFPALCDQAKEYFKYVDLLKEHNIEDETELYTSEGKKCPNCGNYMEKNMGCNHMSCICGFQFCWLCLRDFFQNHNFSNGYTCQAKPVELTVYDSANFFVNKRTHGSKEILRNIMFEHRRLRKSFKVNNAIKLGCRSISKTLMDISVKLIKSSGSKDSKLALVLNHLDVKNSLNDNAFLIINELSIKMDKFFNQLQFNLNYLNCFIEYLALLLNNNSRIFQISNYSFKPNLKNSLGKGIYLYQKTKDLIMYNKNHISLDLMLKFISLNLKIVSFVNNLKHIIFDSLKIYEKYNRISENKS